MFDGSHRRIVCMWFPRLASSRVLRGCPSEAPFALTLKTANAERLYCLNATAESNSLHVGMPLADARALCPDLHSLAAQPDLDARFLRALRRWATRYCPWVACDGRDGLVLDVTRASHLFGGEEPMLEDMQDRLTRAALTVRLGLGSTRGAAWARAHYGTPQGDLGPLPVAALRLEPDIVTALQRLGLRRIVDLQTAARAPLARRFGPELLQLLDQALGQMPEPITPEQDPPHYATRMTLPEPIGLIEDVMGVTGRLLRPLCDKLTEHQTGARGLLLTLQRVDQASQQVELRLASPMRDAARILPLFQRGIEGVEAGYGIDMMRLEVTQAEALPLQQICTATQRSADPDRLNDLITRIGTRIGLDNVQRFLPADGHIPERSFLIAPAAFSQPAAGGWFCPRSRPLWLFPAEAVRAEGHVPPQRFRWRRMGFTTARAIGPERIAPEWWLDDPAWGSGLRDYWKIDTCEGHKLWLFYTPQRPGWFVQGEFA